MVAYVYGDWKYYALRKQGAFESVAALLWPTQGGLGRKEITGPPSADTVRAGIGAEIQQLYKFDVERHALERLQAKLDRLYHDQRSTATQSYGMIFVHHPAAYTYWSNSNHMTADWLRDLGCEIHGPAFSSSPRGVFGRRHRDHHMSGTPSFVSFVPNRCTRCTPRFAADVTSSSARRTSFWTDL